MSLANLLQASFRGVPFLIGDTNTEAGRKVVTHEYPNSDRRTVEDLGLFQDVFTINGLVKTLDNFTDRDRLRDALKAKGQGELVHPFLGTVTVVPRPFTMNESIREIGVARFTMTFEQSQIQIFPTQAAAKPALIKTKSDIAINSINADIGNIFSVDRRAPGNYAAALSQLTGIGDTFSTLGSSISAGANEISDYNNLIDTFSDGLTTNIFNPPNLATTITDIFLQFDVLADNPAVQFALASGLFGFGQDDTAVFPTTVKRQQMANNQLVLNSAMRANALSLAYNNSATIDYGNELELDNTEDQLEAEYQSIISNTNLSSTTLAALQDLRNESRILFDDLSVNVSKIQEIETNEIPMTILAYQYYGDTDQTENLIALNSQVDVSFVEGQVKVLTP